MKIAGFESFPASLILMTPLVWEESREVYEYDFTDADWARLAAGETVLWADDNGDAWLVTRSDDPLDRAEYLVPFEAVEVSIAMAAYAESLVDHDWM